MSPKRKRRPNRHTALRLALVGGFALAAVFGAVIWLDEWLVKMVPQHAANLQVAIMLLATWLMTGILVRAIHYKQPKLPWWTLWLAATAATTIGITLFLAAILLFPSLQVLYIAQSDAAKWVGTMWSFFSALGLLFSLMALIKVRIGNQLWSNLLEIGLLLLVLLLIIKLA